MTANELCAVVGVLPVPGELLRIRPRSMSDGNVSSPVPASGTSVTTAHDAQLPTSLQCARNVPVGLAVNSVLQSLHHVTDTVLTVATGSSTLVTSCVDHARPPIDRFGRPAQQVSSLLRETHGAAPLGQLYFKAVVEAIPRGLLTSRVSPHKHFSAVVQIGASDAVHEAYLLRVCDGRLVSVSMATNQDIAVATVLTLYADEAAFEEVLDGKLTAARAVAMGKRGLT